MIYLDNAATSFPKPEAVYRAMDAFARSHLANPGRAGHKMALAAERALDDCRHLLNQLFHGEAPERFVFTLNCTDALNMAFKGVLREGDHVVTTDLEHNSVSRPLRAMELAGKIGLTRVKADGGGTIDPAAIKKALCDAAPAMGEDRAWLWKVRPYWGHHYHFHVRIYCGPGNRPACQDRAPFHPWYPGTRP